MPGTRHLTVRSRVGRRAAVSATALATVLGSLSLGAGTAQAAEPGPVISAVDVSTPGHATGTVSTSSPYVWLQLGDAAVLAEALPVTDGSADFDLPTWGFDTATVRAVGCAGPSLESCDTETTESQAFTPTDVTPSVTWPARRTIASGQLEKITVSDPQGGGSLRVQWVPDDSAQRRAQQDVNREGTTNLLLIHSSDPDVDGVGETSQVDDGLGALVLQRCSTATTSERCRTVTSTDGGGVEQPVAARMEVDHSFYVFGSPPARVGPDTTSIDLPLTVSDPGTYVVDWQIVTGDRRVPRLGTTTLHPTGTTETLTLPTPLSGGDYWVDAWVRRASSTGGVFTTQLRASLYSGARPKFVIDDAGPSMWNMTAPHADLFPVVDGYRDSTGFTVEGRMEAWYDVTLSIASEDTGEVVHTRSEGDFPVGSPEEVELGPWDGRDAQGVQVPDGSYIATVTARDQFGNASQVRERLWVSSAKLVRKTWSGVVAASGTSLVSARKGRCSTLRAPASRRWAGSLLFGAGSITSCRPRTSADRVVQATNQIRVPALPNVLLEMDYNRLEPNPGKYETLTVYAYGGAARLRGKTRSVAAIRWVNTANRVETARRMSSTLGYHAGYARRADGVVRPDRLVRWNTYASGLSSYDVKSYKVRLTYTVLQ